MYQQRSIETSAQNMFGEEDIVRLDEVRRMYSVMASKAWHIEKAKPCLAKHSISLSAPFIFIFIN